jgi:phage recombination protein Bet
MVPTVVKVTDAPHTEDFGYTPEELRIIKEQVARDLTDAEFRYFLYVASQKRLNPLKKQIYAVKRNDRRLNRQVMTIQTGIEGYRIIADRTGRYAPSDREPVWVEDKGQIVRCTVWVKKLVGGTWHEVPGTVYWSEFVQKDRDGNPTDFWRRMGHNQIAKCAEAHALRKAFPDDLGDIYTTEEMQQADSAVDVTPAVSALPQPRRKSEAKPVEQFPPEPTATLPGRCVPFTTEEPSLEPALRASVEQAQQQSAASQVPPTAEPPSSAAEVSAGEAALPLSYDVTPDLSDEPVLVNSSDLRSLYAAAGEGGHKRDAIKAWLREKYGVTSGAEVHRDWLPQIRERLRDKAPL